jgi:hypothetical protein
MQGQMTGELYFDGILPNGTANTKIGNDSVAINHWEHGNTNAGPPVLPTVFTYVATWGPAPPFGRMEKTLVCLEDI